MNQSNYKLVDSTYDASDAREVLLSIIKDKMTFLQRACFGFEERCGENADHLQKRLKELETTSAEIIELTEKAKENGWMLSINAEIKVDVVVPEPALS